MGLQQYALLKSQISNAAFLSTLYVPIVAIISRIVFKSQLSWVIWIAVLFCLYGSYLLTSDQAIEIQRSDILVFVASFFFAIHIILIDIFMKRLSTPLSFAFIQYCIVFFIALMVALIFEEPTWKGMRLEWFEICYTGIISTAIGYTLQIIAQGKVNPTPAAIILSMESVFASLAGWLILNQVLDNYKIFGCCCIFLGVVMVQIIPIYINKKLN